MLDRLKQFYMVNLNLSLDGEGERGDYMRHGQCWKSIENNIEFVKKTYPQLNLGVYITVSIFNIYKLDSFLKYLIDCAYLDLNLLKLNILVNPRMYSIEILPKIFKLKVLGKLKLLKKYLYMHREHVRFMGLIKQVTDLERSLSGPGDKQLLQKFLKENKRLDEIRNERFSDIFREEYQLLKEYDLC